MRHLCQNLLACALVFAWAAPDSHAQSRKREAAAITRAMRARASRLEAGLPRVRFAYWLQSVVGGSVKVSWEVNDCGEQSGTAADRGRDFPMCVEASGLRGGGERVGVQIQVGSFRKGIRGEPVLRMAYVERAGTVEEFNKLSDLAAKLKGVGSR